MTLLPATVIVALFPLASFAHTTQAASFFFQSYNANGTGFVALDLSVTINQTTGQIDYHESWTNCATGCQMEANIYITRRQLSPTTGALIATQQAGSAGSFHPGGQRHYSTLEFGWQAVEVVFTKGSYTGALLAKAATVFPADQPVPSSCPSGQSFSNVVVGYSGGTLEAYFKWTGPTSIGWNVNVPNPNTNPPYPAPQMVVQPSQVEGFQGVYGGAVAVSLTDLNGYRISKRDDAACYITGAMLGTRPSPADTGTGAVTEDGQACGINMFCIIKAAFRWAFVPSAATYNAWTSFRASVQARPPVSFATGAHEVIVELQSASGSNLAGDICFGGDEVIGIPDACVYNAAQELNQGGSWQTHFWGIRTTIKAGLWVGFIFIVWRRATASIGAKPEADDPS